MQRLGRLALWATLGGVALATAGCGTGGISEGKADTSNGKALFQQKCGSCHTLADAGTQGKVGPNLDDAFAGPRSEGFDDSTFRNVVHDQILYPIQEPVGYITTPDGKQQRAPGMPADLVTGDDANDVAAYVASVAGVAAVGADDRRDHDLPGADAPATDHHRAGDDHRRRRPARDGQADLPEGRLRELPHAQGRRNATAPSARTWTTRSRRSRS